LIQDKITPTLNVKYVTALRLALAKPIVLLLQLELRNLPTLSALLIPPPNTSLGFSKMTKIIDPNAVPTLQDAVQEILALCNNSGALRATEPNDWNVMIYRKQKLLPRIQAYNNTSDHEYLAALIKLRDDLADQTPMAVGWVTSMIMDQVAAMDRKAADLEVNIITQCTPVCLHCSLAPSTSDRFVESLSLALRWPPRRLPRHQR